MASYYIETDDAAELMLNHGYSHHSLTDFRKGDKVFTVASFETKRIISLHKLNRLPRLVLTANQIIELSLLPNEEVREALTDAWEQELLGVKSDVNSASNAHCYVENNRMILNLLHELSIDIDKFYFPSYNHFSTPKYTMLSILPIPDETIVEFYAEGRNTMNFKHALTISQDVFEAIKLIPKEAREEYLAAMIKDTYNKGTKELSKQSNGALRVCSSDNTRPDMVRDSRYSFPLLM